MLKLKQYFCKHNNMKRIAMHKHTTQSLWQCPDCEVYRIFHWGLGVAYYNKTPHIEGWEYTNKQKGG